MPRSQYDRTTLRDGDRVEIVQAIGGGGAPIRASLALETVLGLAVLVLVAILGRLAPFGDG